MNEFWIFSHHLIKFELCDNFTSGPEGFVSEKKSWKSAVAFTQCNEAHGKLYFILRYWFALAVKTTTKCGSIKLRAKTVIALTFHFVVTSDALHLKYFLFRFGKDTRVRFSDIGECLYLGFTWVWKAWSGMWC